MRLTARSTLEQIERADRKDYQELSPNHGRLAIVMETWRDGPSITVAGDGCMETSETAFMTRFGKLCLLRAGTFVGFGLLPLAIGCAQPAWYLDHGFGERLARQENKPLLFYFKAWDSTQHRNMRLKVFNDPAVKAELLKTVNLELEFSWSTPYKERYGVSNPQICVMCKPDGTKVGHALYANPVPTVARFLDWFKSTLSEALPPTASAPSESAEAGKRGP